MVEKKLRVLAVGAHPDDLENACAGTLAKFARAGHTVIMCYVCKGDAASYELSPEEIAALRAEEAREAAEVIGAEFIAGLGLGDGQVYVNEENTILFMDLIRRTKPDLIITHNPEDYLQDHMNTGRLVFEASLFSSTENIKSKYPAHPVIPPIFYMEPYGSLNFQPTEYVEITDVIDVKREMLSKHRSQLEFMKEHYGDDMLERMEAVARFRGIQANVRYAEGFIPMLRWPRVMTERLLP
jgi:LmbE family N-acetylglucosaminyl deacetylase